MNGKICYVEIPATDPKASAAFYEKVFGWKSRARGDGVPAFDDTTGQVSGSFLKGRKPSREPGIMTYVMVDHIEGTLAAIEKAGGKTVTAKTAIGGGGYWASFTDLAGNLIGLYGETQK
ncbi:MAG TPA: VOC family protein [Gemmatimonadales bacterium]|jgi:hypothetical protein